MASTPLNPTQMTPPRVAFIDPRTGSISREWYRFFLSLWTATGTTQNIIETNTYESSSISSYEASLNALSQAVEQSPNTESALASYEEALATLANAFEQSPDTASALASCCESVISLAQTLGQAPDTESALAALEAELRKSIFSFESASNALTQEQSDVAEIQKRIDALEASPISTPQIPQFVYGCFFSTANQPDGSTTTAYPILYDSTAYSKNVTLADRTATFTASIGPASTTMTVTAISAGTIYPGMVISGTGVTVGTRIVSQTTGTIGGTGDYVVDISQTVASTTITGTCKSILKAEIAGVYNVQFSVQMVNTDANIHDIDIWLRKNGTNVTESNSVFSVPSKHAGVDGHNIGALNLFIDLAADEYVELMWHTNDTATTIQYIAPQTSPIRPGTPSVIITLNLVSLPTLQGV